MVVADEASQRAMEAADVSKEEGIDADNNFGPSGSRGSRDGVENRQGKPSAKCWYYGKKGYKESECWKKCTDSEKTGSGSGRTEQGNR